MHKDFDKWNIKKKKINNKETNISFMEGQIWWCSAGLNIGHEIDGKHSAYERPFYILKKCSETMFIGIPCTSSNRLGLFTYLLKTNNFEFTLNFSQIKTLSSKRLLRKVVHIPDPFQIDIITRLFNYIKRKSAQ